MRIFLLKIKFCCFVALIGFTQQAAAQNEGAVLRHLDINPVLINAANRQVRVISFQELERSALKLPFFDDFSCLHSPFPNDSLWEDNMVFINTGFPLFPPTIGVATFDPLDATGRLYEHLISYSSGGADTLTSRPIRLDSIFDENGESLREITIADSVFLSFYFQPGGGFGTSFDATNRGREHTPVSGDSLVLELRNDAGDWTLVWSANGQSLEQFCPLCVVDSVLVTPATDTTAAVFRRVEDFEKEFFRQVAILVPADYFHCEFQFRFRNRGRGQWHVDYVRLDTFPNGFSGFSSDIAFVQPSNRVLREFQAMPANQFHTSDLVSEIPILFRNLDSVMHFVSYHFQITGAEQSPPFFWSTATVTNADVEPFHTHGFNYNTDIYEFQRNFSSHFPNVVTPGIFEFQHVLRSVVDINRSNDTMTQTVHFGDYFAYDDGTPESGFGFSRQGTNQQLSQFAYKFPLRVADSLVGIQIWLNHTENVGGASFNLAVWGENNGVPAQIPILEGQNLLLANLYDDTIGFFTYWFDAPIGLSPGNFFIGFEHRSNFFLNVGFDLNNNAENRMFERLNNGQWAQLFLYGSVMMRPVFGTSESIPPTSILDRDEHTNVSENIRVFPNPSDGIVFVETSETIINRYEIFDLSGRRLLQGRINDTRFSINLPERSGLYILVLHSENGVVSKRVVRR